MHWNIHKLYTYSIYSRMHVTNFLEDATPTRFMDCGDLTDIYSKKHINWSLKYEFYKKLDKNNFKSHFIIVVIYLWSFVSGTNGTICTLTTNP